MPSSEILHRLAVVRTDVSEERIASIIRVTRIGELGTSAVTNNTNTLPGNIIHYRAQPILVTVMIEAIRYSETSALTRAIRPNIPEDPILQNNTFLCL
jgi:hypothetical protein